jgi:glutathione S-transferase
MSYIVYGDKGSGAFSVEAALAEAGAAYEFREISLEKDEQKSESFLTINPSGKIPALQLPEGGVVTESAALLLLIAERHPEAKLMPDLGTPERAEALRWLAFMASEIYPIVEIADYPERFFADHKAAAILGRSAKQRIRERLIILESGAMGPWFLGEAYSLIDIYAVMFTRWREAREGGWRDDYLPKICAIAAALADRPFIKPVYEKHFPNG